MVRLIFAASFSGVEIYTYPDQLPPENSNAFDISGWSMFDLSTGSAGSWYVERQDDYFYVGYVEPVTDYKGRSSFITAAVGLPRNLLTNQLDYVNLARQIETIVTHYFKSTSQATAKGLEFSAAVKQAQSNTQMLQRLQPQSFPALSSIKPEYPANFSKDLFANKFDQNKSKALSCLYPIHSEDDLVNWIAAILYHDYESPNWSSHGYLRPIFADRVGLFTSVASLHDHCGDAPSTPATLVYSLLNPNVFNGVRSLEPLEERLRERANYLNEVTDAVTAAEKHLEYLETENRQLQAVNSDFKAKLDEMQEDVIRLQNENYRLVDDLATAKLDLESVNATIDSHQQKLNAVLNDFDEAQNKYNELVSFSKELSAKYSPNDIDMPSAFLLERKELNARLQWLDSAEASNEKVKRELELERIELQKLDSQIKQANEHIEAQLTQAKEINKEPYQAGYRLGHKEGLSNGAEARDRFYKPHIERLNEEISKLNNEKKAIEADASTLQNFNTQLQQNYKNLAAQLPKASHAFLQNFAFGLLMTLMFLILLFAFFKWL